MKTDSMQIKDNKIYIGKFPLEELATKYHTPLYVYDEKQIQNEISKYLSIHVDNVNVNIVYASKAFLAPRLCDILKDNNLFIDAVSSGDLYLIKSSKFPMSKVVLHGNNKSIEDITLALKYKIGYIVCDNIAELKRLEEIAKSRKQKVTTLFRVNPGVEAHTHAFVQTSMLDSKFGESIYDEDKMRAIMEFYQNSKYLTLEGFHAHIGSQINDENSFVSFVHVMTKFTKKMSEKYHYQAKTLDFGGGIAIKYLDSDIEVNISQIISDMVKTCINDFKGSKIKIENIMFEPGRSIVGDAGVTLYTCGGVKRTFAGKEYIFVDGGMPDNIRPALYDAKYTIDNASYYTRGQDRKIFDVAGKCCESGDVICRHITLETPQEKDILVTYATGAYCYSMSMNYNGLVRGGVIFVDDDKVYEVIKRESYRDLIRNCVFKKEDK